MQLHVLIILLHLYITERSDGGSLRMLPAGHLTGWGGDGKEVPIAKTSNSACNYACPTNTCATADTIIPHMEFPGF